MIILALLLKPVFWFAAFRFAIKGSVGGMMRHALGITVLLTLIDAVTVAGNLALPAILLTLVLYALMSFTLIPVAWKLKKPALSTSLNLAGVAGAFAGVNFTMDCIRGFLPFMNP